MQGIKRSMIIWSLKYPIRVVYTDKSSSNYQASGTILMIVRSVLVHHHGKRLFYCRTKKMLSKSSESQLNVSIFCFLQINKIR